MSEEKNYRQFVIQKEAKDRDFEIQRINQENQRKEQTRKFYFQ
jgi:hypothetical protein